MAGADGGDDVADGLAGGSGVGFVDEELVAWGDPQETLRTVLASLGGDAELLTVIAGPDAPLTGAEIARLAPDGVELELSHGGQPSYWWLIAAE